MPSERQMRMVLDEADVYINSPKASNLMRFDRLLCRSYNEE